ncbi:MAG: hypothetical protein KKA73_06155 [Chloroflexi bacterium]|nr:hypothetical protein [Chloroflexota bacterium]MBU1747252.1 hypothetical protein [Chloroflexota bacterium]
MNRNAIVAIIGGLLLACCCVAVAYALISAGGLAALINAPAPYNIDQRLSVPAGTTSDSVFPARAYSLSHQYQAGPASPTASFAGVALPAGAAGVTYSASGAEQVQMFAAEAASEAQARQLVTQFKDRVASAPAQSQRYRNAPGQAAFAQWHAANTYGIVWTNGPWVFGVTSVSETGRDAVADFIEY